MTTKYTVVTIKAKDRNDFPCFWGERFVVDEIYHGELVTLVLMSEEEFIAHTEPQPQPVAKKPIRRRRYRPLYRKGDWVEWKSHQGVILQGTVAKYKNKILSVVDVFTVTNGGIMSRAEGDNWYVNLNEEKVTKLV